MPSGETGRWGMSADGLPVGAESRAVGARRGRADGYSRDAVSGAADRWEGYGADVVTRAVRPATGRSVITSLTGKPGGRWRELGRH